MEQTETLPKIEKKVLEKEIENAGEDTWLFFHIFIDRYYEIAAKDPSGKVFCGFSDEQHILICFLALEEEVNNGGFVQFFFNGYGFIMELPFSERIKSWGAEKTAEIVDEVKPIYKRYEKEFKSARTLEDLSELYSKMPEFKALNEKYYKIEGEAEKIKKHVKDHIDEFAIII